MQGATRMAMSVSLDPFEEMSGLKLYFLKKCVFFCVTVWKLLTEFWRAFFWRQCRQVGRRDFTFGGRLRDIKLRI